jgi:cobaltochelatase CobT
MLVISDGAPGRRFDRVGNGGTYLERHLRQVIGWIEGRSTSNWRRSGSARRDTLLFARRYDHGRRAIGRALIEQLAALFDKR